MSDHLPAWLRGAAYASRDRTGTATISEEDGLLQVEAATASAALADVHRAVGPDARIIGADKVLRGGLWGFFQKEMVQLTVDPDDGPHDPAADDQEDDEPLTDTDDAGLAGVLARLAADESEAEVEFGTTLRRQLGVLLEEEQDAATVRPSSGAAESTIRPAVRANPILHAPAPAAAPEPVPAPEPVRAPEAAPATATFAVADQRGTWSGRNLLRLGLPHPLVDAVVSQQPMDDAGWTYALARALSPLCRPLPTGDVALVGPRAERLARSLGIAMSRTSARARTQGSFAAAIRDGEAGRGWLRANLGRRWTHLVIGGTGWEGLLFEDPLAVSWVGEGALVDAIRVAHDLGLVLGHGLPERGSEAVRAAPMDLAIALRHTLEGHR